MSVETIRTHIRELRLYTAAHELEEVLNAQKKSVPISWLEDLLARECDARHERSIVKRIRNAEFLEMTYLETFDWDFNPELDKNCITRLSYLDFIKNRRIALFLGKPGTGKSHLVIAIGMRAIHAGHKVY